MSEKILLIDGHSILNRAFYGLPDLTNAEGLSYRSGIWISEYYVQDHWRKRSRSILPLHLICSAPTFRHKRYEAYKGTRKPMPEELAGTGSADQGDAFCHGNQHHVPGRL